MAKAIVKTVETKDSVVAFLAKQKDEQVRKDCGAITKLMEKATGERARMWGTSIVGFGNRVFTSPATGRQVDWFYCGFSPRKQNITLYLNAGGYDKHAELLAKLGKHKVGGGCLYIKKLADVDVKVLEKLIVTSVKGVKKMVG